MNATINSRKKFTFVKKKFNLQSHYTLFKSIYAEHATSNFESHVKVMLAGTCGNARK